MKHVRCTVRQPGDVAQSGLFLGLMFEHDDIVAVVKLDGHGMFVTTAHPSRVDFTEESHS